MPARALALALLFLVPAAARAEDSVTVGQLTVDGQEVRELACSLKDGGFFAMMGVVGTLSKQKKALDACLPTGGAFVVKWAWQGGKATSAEVVKASNPKKSACVAEALKLTRTDAVGTCSALVLVGEAATAGKAADALVPPPAPPAPAPAPTKPAGKP